MKPWLRDLIDSLTGKKRAERAKLVDATFYAMTSPHGQILLAHLLDEIYFTISHAPGMTARDTAYNEGQRSVVQLILDLMNEQRNPKITEPEVEK